MCFHSWTHILLTKLNLFWTIFWTSESCVTSFSAPDGSQMQRSADCPQSKRNETSSSLSQLSPPTRGTSGSRLSTINESKVWWHVFPPTGTSFGSAPKECCDFLEIRKKTPKSDLFPQISWRHNLFKRVCFGPEKYRNWNKTKNIEKYCVSLTSSQ